MRFLTWLAVTVFLWHVYGESAEKHTLVRFMAAPVLVAWVLGGMGAGLWRFGKWVMKFGPIKSPPAG